jgi:hypothetical protein
MKIKLQHPLESNLSLDQRKTFSALKILGKVSPASYDLAIICSRRKKISTWAEVGVGVKEWWWRRAPGGAIFHLL